MSRSGRCKSSYNILVGKFHGNLREDGRAGPNVKLHIRELSLGYVNFPASEGGGVLALVMRQLTAGKKREISDPYTPYGILHPPQDLN
jgi:hypothetical protein